MILNVTDEYFDSKDKFFFNKGIQMWPESKKKVIEYIILKCNLFMNSIKKGRKYPSLDKRKIHFRNVRCYMK